MSGVRRVLYAGCEVLGAGGAAGGDYDAGGYTNWMQGAMQIFPDGRYELMAWAVDEARQKLVAAVFHATHTGEGGPVAPTGKSMATDYVYVMEFGGGKIVGMTKVWNAGLAMKALGWA